MASLEQHLSTVSYNFPLLHMGSSKHLCATQWNALHGPERAQRRGVLVLRHTQNQRGRLGRPVLRAQSPRGLGEQLDRDGSRQRLLPVLPLLWPQRVVFDGTWKMLDIELMQ